MSCWVEISWNPILPSETVGLVCSMLWVVIHLHCKRLSGQFHLAECEQTVRPSPLTVLLYQRVRSSINTRDSVPLAAIQAHAITSPPLTDDVICLGS